MRLYLLHVDPSSDEAHVVVPGLEGTVLPAPIDTLPRWLPAMDAALDDHGPQACPACGQAPVTAEAAERSSAAG